MNQLETIIRPDPAVQLSFGRRQCAHSSQVHDTLDACTSETVMQLQHHHDRMYRTYGHAFHHDFSSTHLLLDLDLTGLLASKQAEGSTKGYFANKRGAWGRQLCRLLTSPYQEILCQTLLSGDTLSQVTLKPALQHAEQLLQFTKSQRQRTLVRWDAGFGTDKNINWMLSHDYHILGKVYAHRRVSKLRQSVTEWLPTPSSPGRFVGFVTAPHRYARKTQQWIVKTPKKSPENAWGYGAIVTTLLDTPALDLVDLYDDRGGGIETAFRADRQGLGIGKRRKHQMVAQQMLIHLAERAHNLLVWTVDRFGPPLNQYGIVRLVRDALPISGYVLFVHGHPREIGLNRRHPLASALCDGLNQLFSGTPQIRLWEPVEYIKER